MAAMRPRRRPTGILGMLLYLARGAFLRASLRRGFAILLALAAVLFLLWRGAWGGTRVATFNVENYPRSDQQEAGAFDAIRSLDAVAVGVQEIKDPAAFADAARRRLGDAWRFVFAEPSPEQRVGVLFDSSAVALLSTRTIRETETYPSAKPAFEARLARSRGDALRLIVVHLKAGGDSSAVRRDQIKALLPVVAAAVATGDQVVLFGDFNATGEDDRRAIEALAAATGMEWASKGLSCTSYWSRSDGCLGSALDHVLTSPSSRGVRARGPCETEGCAPGATCPIFHRDVSDHCPVSVDLR